MKHSVKHYSQACHYYLVTAKCLCGQQAQRKGQTLGEAKSKAKAWEKDHIDVQTTMDEKGGHHAAAG